MVSRPRLSGRSTHARRARVSAGLAIALLLIHGASALADPAPTVPSAEQVAAAAAAVTDQQARVDALEAEYARASAELADVQHAVSRTAAGYAAAQRAADSARASAQAAQLAAEHASGVADAARESLSRTAAAAYEQGGSAQYVLLGLLGDGPQMALDLAQYLDDAATSLDRDLREAALLAGAATSARAFAQDRAALLADALADAERSHARLQTQVDQAAGQVAALAARQRAMVSELAALRRTSEEEQQQRLDALALAAAAAARAEAERAAREAATRPPTPTPAASPTRSVRPTTPPPSSTTPPSSSSSTTAPRPTTSTTSSTTSTPSPTPTTPPNLAWMQANPRAVAQQLMPSFGFGTDQWSCLDSLWQKESNWYWAADNPYSSAYGIPQALPGSKMSTAGADWLVNPATQITWGLGYIKGRYGSPCSAWAAWQSRSPHWY